MQKAGFDEEKAASARTLGGGDAAGDGRNPSIPNGTQNCKPSPKTTAPAIISGEVIFRKFLDRRHISHATIDLFQVKFTIHRGRPAIIYPVIDAGGRAHPRRRIKYLAGEGMKYTWTGKAGTDTPVYYNLAGLEHARGDTLTVASGEPDVWAHYETGNLAVFCWLGGESSKPANLVDQLHAYDIRRVVSYTDRDDAGDSMAIWLRDTLAAAGIEYVPYALPGADGYDLGKHWQQFAGDAAAFRAALEQLPLLELPEPAVPASKPRDSFDGPPPADILALWQRYTEQLGTALVIDKYKPDGWSRKNIRCPMGTHQDRNPSAGYNRETGTLHCFVCGSHSAHEVAAAIGFTSWDDYKVQHAPLHVSRETLRRGTDPRRRRHETSAQDQESPPQIEPVPGLPTSTRRSLCAQKLHELARLLDMLYTAGVKPGDRISAARAIEIVAGRMGSNKTRELLSDEVFDAAPAAPVGAGRPHMVYIMPTPARVRTVYEKFGERYTNEVHILPAGALDGAKDYRAAVQLAYIQANPGQHSRAALGEAVGVSKSTTLRYQKLHGRRYKVTPCFEYQKVGDVAHTLPARTLPFLGGVWIESATGQAWPADRESAHYLRDDPKARVCRRRPNVYEITEPLRVANPVQREQNSVIDALRAAGELFSRVCNTLIPGAAQEPRQNREKIPAPLPKSAQADRGGRILERMNVLTGHTPALGVA
jgi:hypothetical protein